MALVRYCADCDEEFRIEILVCSDCGATLSPQEEGAGRAGGPPPGEAAIEDRPIEELRHVATAPTMDDFELMAAAFAERGVPSRVVVQNGAYAIFVREEDLRDAAEAVRALRAAAAGDEGADDRFDPAAGRYVRCPACDVALTSDATECPECGLEFSGGEAAPDSTPGA